MRNKQIPSVTVAILILNAIGLVYVTYAGEWNAASRFAMYQGALRDGEWSRVLFSAFLHYGVLHFGSNMVCLFLYGWTLEPKIGPFKFALIYGVSILGAGLLINYLGGNGAHMGASGAIWGLMAATLVYTLRNGLNPFYAVRGIVLNLIYSFSAGVSWQGHIGGGIAGALIALAVCGREGPPRREEQR